MKKIIAWITILGLNIGTMYAQTQSTTPTTSVVKPAKPSHVIPASQNLKPAPVVPVSDQKTRIKPAHVTPVHPVKKDGTPDRRFSSNKKLKKDGTPDARFKVNKQAAIPDQPKK